jgi:hypothetical protein
MNIALATLPQCENSSQEKSCIPRSIAHIKMAKAINRKNAGVKISFKTDFTVYFMIANANPAIPDSTHRTTEHTNPKRRRSNSPNRNRSRMTEKAVTGKDSSNRLPKKEAKAKLGKQRTNKQSAQLKRPYSFRVHYLLPCNKTDWTLMFTDKQNAGI